MKKISFCGGGSAGHVMPNVALIEELKGEYEISYIGTDAIERDICRARGIKFVPFDGVKLQRGKILVNLKIPFRLLKSVRQCKKIIEAEKPDLLFCKGGYACVPPAIAAAKAKIPVLTHESDLSMGLANKFIARKCRRVLTAFPSTSRKLKNGVYAGTPMRADLFGRDKDTEKRKLGLDNRPVILVFGGGSGSEIINENIRKIAAKLCRTFNVLHVCGKGRAVQTNIDGYRQIEFTEDMGALYACADYAVARCGSNSAHELIALKIPTLFIPLGNKSSRGDQIANADYFFSEGLCRVLHEKDLNPERLETEIRALVADDNIKSALQGCNLQRGNEFIKEEIKAALR